MTSTSVALAAAIILTLSGCGSGGDGSSPQQAAPTTAEVTTTTSPLPAYARALLDIRARHMISNEGAGYARAAEALNLLTPPPGFELRHRQLVEELLLVARLTDQAMSNIDFAAATRAGSAQGAAHSRIENLARDADPTAR